CAICGFNVTLRNRPIALEAAHIKWRMAKGPDKEGNGIALCSLHHKLFDRGAFTLSDQLEVRVSEYVDKTSVGFEEWLKQFDGREIDFPPQEQIYYPNENFTRWHLKEVFKEPYQVKT
ncbi:MAG: HNH endonuclease, partial [Candidatus Poribacteria bacterium]|nr:HNH endonuclease [Candidatus Poribacteria bacterium]